MNNNYINMNVSNIRGDADKYLYEQAKFRQYHENKNQNLGNLNFSTQKNNLRNVVENSESIVDYIETQKNPYLSNNDYLSNNMISTGNGMDMNMLMAMLKLQQKPKQMEIRYRKTSLGIDSDSRDTTKYLYQNNYKLNLRHPFSNIESIKMKDSVFINTQQLIRETPVAQKNNVIQWNIKKDTIDTAFDTEFVVYTTTLTPGNYNETSLAKEIETQMNSVRRTTGLFNNFNVSIDSVTDIVSITSISFTTLSNPLSFSIPESKTYTEINVSFVKHGFRVGSRIYIENAIVTGLQSSLINTSHIITSITDINNFSFRISSLSTKNEYGVGGTILRIGSGIDFQLLWSSSNTPSTILGFSKIDTGFATEHTNTKESFKYSNTSDTKTKEELIIENRIKINYMKSNTSGMTTIRTELPHNLITGSRIYLYTNESKPSTSTIKEYNHLYGLLVSDLSEDEQNLRDTFLAGLTAPSGLIVTYIDTNEISVPIPYATISKIELKKETYDDDDTFGDIIIKDKNLPIDLSGEKYIYMCSPQIGGDMIDTSGRVDDIFAKIQLAGKANSTIFNGFSGGIKRFFEEPLKSLEEIEFYFRTKDGELFEFNDKDHSFVLEITEAVQTLQ